VVGDGIDPTKKVEVQIKIGRVTVNIQCEQVGRGKVTA